MISLKRVAILLKITDTFVAEYWSIEHCVILGKRSEVVTLVDMNIQSAVVSGTVQQVYDFCKYDEAVTYSDLRRLFGMDIIDLEK